MTYRFLLSLLNLHIFKTHGERKVKKTSLILGILFALSGCGNANNEENNNKTEELTGESSADLEDLFQKSEEFASKNNINDNSVFIDCLYNDGSNINYKIENGIISSYDESKNQYIDGVIYLTDRGRKGGWRGPGQGWNDRISLNVSKDNFKMDIISKTSFNPNSEPVESKSLLVDINRKTGTVSTSAYNPLTQDNDDDLMPNSTYIVARCSPGSSMVSEVNSF